MVAQLNGSGLLFLEVLHVSLTVGLQDTASSGKINVAGFTAG